ncbi:hypothetical protein [Alkalihalophilus pseudofirmus]|nr:hypothetical protein [Alkalihalophilus pseudofirmus]
MDKEQAISLCEDLLRNEEEVSEVTYLYLFWNMKQNYETKTFEWLLANATLLASLQEQAAANEIFIDMLKKMNSYQDAVKLMKDPEEVREFNRYTNVVPLFS